MRSPEERGIYYAPADTPGGEPTGIDPLRELYKEWLRTVGAPHTDEELEFITHGIFDAEGWGQKSAQERQAYQDQLKGFIDIHQKFHPPSSPEQTDGG
jgi:hypothetical protein